MRKLGGLLGLVLLASLMPATAEGKLTKPERRAVDISGVTGASTSSAMLAEVSFAGRIGEALGRGALRRAQVKVEALTASGQTTVITERGAARRSRHSRTGTAGAIEVVRGERSLLLLVEGLSEPIRQMTVSTGTGAAGAARDGVVFDQVSAPIRVLDYQEAIDHERQRVEREIEFLEGRLEELEANAEDAMDELHKAEQRRRHSDSRVERERARKKAEELKSYLERNTARRTARRLELRALRRWHDILSQIRIIVILPLSSAPATGG
jgi:hypothetical protein